MLGSCAVLESLEKYGSLCDSFSQLEECRNLENVQTFCKKMDS